MRRLLVVIGLLSMALPAYAQDRPRTELFGGYSYLRLDDEGGDSPALNGFAVEGHFSLDSRNKIYLVNGLSRVSTSSSFLNDVSVDRDLTILSIGACVRQPVSKISIWACGQGGLARDRQTGTSGDVTVSEAQTSTMVVLAGARVDLDVSPRVGVRLLGADLVRTTSFGDANRTHFRLSAGVVLRIGQP